MSTPHTNLAERRSTLSMAQAEFVQWWRENVSVNHGGPRGKSKCADRGTWSMEQAEQLTGITHQQVAKWAKRLKDREKYRLQLYGVATVRAVRPTTANQHQRPKAASTPRKPSATAAGTAARASRRQRRILDPSRDADRLPIQKVLITTTSGAPCTGQAGTSGSRPSGRSDSRKTATSPAGGP